MCSVNLNYCEHILDYIYINKHSFGVNSDVIIYIIIFDLIY